MEFQVYRLDFLQCNDQLMHDNVNKHHSIKGFLQQYAIFSFQKLRFSRISRNFLFSNSSPLSAKKFFVNLIETLVSFEWLNIWWSLNYRSRRSTLKLDERSPFFYLVCVKMSKWYKFGILPDSPCLKIITNDISNLSKYFMNILKTEDHYPMTYEVLLLIVTIWTLTSIMPSIHKMIKHTLKIMLHLLQDF